jgi:hypothetical protein
MIDDPPPALVDMDLEVQVWRLCRFDKTIFQREEYQRSHSTRLNPLACLLHHKNAHISLERRMMDELYHYILFFCVRTFNGQPHICSCTTITAR